jgi:hypothetical protein
MSDPLYFSKESLGRGEDKAYTVVLFVFRRNSSTLLGT